MDLGYIGIITILSIALNIYLVYKVFTLQDESKVKLESIQRLKSYSLVEDNKCDDLESKYLASKDKLKGIVTYLENRYCVKVTTKIRNHNNIVFYIDLPNCMRLTKCFDDTDIICYPYLNTAYYLENCILTSWENLIKKG